MLTNDMKETVVEGGKQSIPRYKIDKEPINAPSPKIPAPEFSYVGCFYILVIVAIIVFAVKYLFLS